MIPIYPANISRKEMLHSRTAIALEIDNSVSNDQVEYNLLRTAWTLQILRDKIKLVTGQERAIIVSSGYRCVELNNHPKIGSSKNSAHVHGYAADFTVKGWTVREVISFITKYLPELEFDQLINEYDKWVHLGLKRYTGETRGQIFNKT